MDTAGNRLKTKAFNGIRCLNRASDGTKKVGRGAGLTTSLYLFFTFFFSPDFLLKERETERVLKRPTGGGGASK